MKLRPGPYCSQLMSNKGRKGKVMLPSNYAARQHCGDPVCKKQHAQVAQRLVTAGNQEKRKCEKCLQQRPFLAGAKAQINGINYKSKLMCGGQIKIFREGQQRLDWYVSGIRRSLFLQHLTSHGVAV
jgi:hypothetical protein